MRKKLVKGRGSLSGKHTSMQGDVEVGRGVKESGIEGRVRDLEETLRKLKGGGV